MIRETAAARPNVANGGLGGLIAAIIVMLVSVQQGEVVALESWIATLVSLIGAVVAYFFHNQKKTIGAVIGAGLATLVVLVITLLRSEVVDSDLLTSLLSDRAVCP
jgi:uncharacterized membrane protein YgaE (UPF0421/DUF939 family)